MTAKFCIVCGNNENSYENLTFHIFPKDEVRSKKWTEILFGANATNQSMVGKRLCSKHFSAPSFLNGRLSKIAEPLPFAHSDNIHSDHKCDVVNEAMVVAGSSNQCNRADLVTLIPEELPISETEQINAQVLNELKHLRAENGKILKILEKLEAKFAERNNVKDQFDAPRGFPLATMEAFEEFEEKKINEHQELQSHLEFVGGQNLRDALHNFIRVGMTSELAFQFTWTGKTNQGGIGKAALYKSKLSRIFHRAAIKIFPGKFTRAEYISNMQEVLRSYKQTRRNANNDRPRKRELKTETLKYYFMDDELD